ncbi:MAG: PAS domain-containing sensor histidine kinase [Rhodospirillales bacterium]|nr:PAS domain-containing sensor histidine kinase [Rhodospirillales bacterium]
MTDPVIPSTPDSGPDSGQDSETLSKIRRYLAKHLGQLFLSRRFAFVLAALAVGLGVTTFGLFTGTSTGSGTADAQQVLHLLYADLVVLLLLGVIIAQRLVAMWAQRRRGMAGSALHVRLVVMFSLLTVTPAILVAIFAALFLNFGIDSWFSSRVRTAVEASQAVASAYLDEHVHNIRADALAMANDLNREAARLSSSPLQMERALTTQAGVRGLTEALMVGENGQILAQSAYSVLSPELTDISADALARADAGEIIVLTARNTDRVRALVKLDRYVGAYLLVGRFVDVQVLINMERVREASQSYLRLEERSGTIQITFVAIFAVVALLLLMAAVWIGMTIANQMARPISNLIDAAQRVSGGDLSQRVTIDETIGEMATLSEAFNTMTGKLAAQQDGLMQMNRQLDERRRFTETVLGGVSAGVIGLDAQGRVDLSNRSAKHLLGVDLEAAKGQHLSQVVPEMSEILAESMDRPDRVARAEVPILIDGHQRSLIASTTAEYLGEDVIGYVLTFDDITELQSAQRTAAWSGVARRIAHEIKNPLTPIQLSAERLKRKYLKQIKEDPETFVTCTDTIVRQVEELGRMVDEFSSFARMPQAVLKPESLPTLCRQAVFLEKNRDTSISVQSELPDGDILINCDAQQISRALTNLLKNATESVEERLGKTNDEGGGEGNAGWIRLRLLAPDGKNGLGKAGGALITIEDNGTGLPEADLGRLTEPYVSTRERGTGLGLAIVKKIMEDHGGELILENRPSDEHGGGARVMLLFPPV